MMVNEVLSDSLHVAQDVMLNAGGGDQTLQMFIAGMSATFAQAKHRIESLEFQDDVATKVELMNLYREVDAAVNQCTQLKDEIRHFVEQWKGKLSGETGDATSDSTDVEPPLVECTDDDDDLDVEDQRAGFSVHTDHLGASTYLEKGWSKISSGDHEGAEATLMQALELSPNHIEAQALLGWAQMLQDKLDAALMNFHDVLSREPTNALARINVGYICLKKGIFGEAIEHLSRALHEDNDSRAVLYANFYLGLVYIEREMYEDAQAFFDRAIALGPNLVEAYFELGHAYWLAGKPDEAVAVWERGATVNKYNGWSQRCAKTVEDVNAGCIPKRGWLSRGE